MFASQFNWPMTLFKLDVLLSFNQWWGSRSCSWFINMVFKLSAYFCWSRLIDISFFCLMLMLSNVKAFLFSAPTWKKVLNLLMTELDIDFPPHIMSSTNKWLPPLICYASGREKFPDPIWKVWLLACFFLFVRFFFFFFFLRGSGDSLHVRLNSHYKV